MLGFWIKKTIALKQKCAWPGSKIKLKTKIRPDSWKTRNINSTKGKSPKKVFRCYALLICVKGLWAWGDVVQTVLQLIYVKLVMMSKMLWYRDQTILKITEFFYCNQILGVIYPIRADAHDFFVLR